MNLPYDNVKQDSENQPPVIEIRDIVHAAKLLRLLRAKESLIAVQIECVRNYLKDKS